MQANLPRICSKVYEEPWLILPSAHEGIRKSLESYFAAPGSLSLGEAETSPEAEPQEEDRFDGAGVLPIFGILGRHISWLEMECGGCSIDLVQQELARMVEDPTIDRIILNISSPGGTVTGTPELARQIREADQVKPVYAYTENLCCSAAYWLASQCREIWATPSAQLGSVGVYLFLLDETAALEKEGLKVNAISAGKWKLSGAPWRELTQEERAMFQAGVDKTWDRFKAAATDRRPIGEEYLEGQCFDGEEALEYGLATNEALTIEDVLAETRQREAESPLFAL